MQVLFCTLHANPYMNATGFYCPATKSINCNQASGSKSEGDGLKTVEGIARLFMFANKVMTRCLVHKIIFRIKVINKNQNQFFFLQLIWILNLLRGLRPAALRRQPAGDRRAVQAVFVTAPPPARVPAGPLHQPGPWLQVALLRHRQGKTQSPARPRQPSHRFPNLLEFLHIGNICSVSDLSFIHELQFWGPHLPPSPCCSPLQCFWGTKKETNKLSCAQNLSYAVKAVNDDVCKISDCTELPSFKSLLRTHLFHSVMLSFYCFKVTYCVYFYYYPLQWMSFFSLSYDKLHLILFVYLFSIDFTLMCFNLISVKGLWEHWKALINKVYYNCCY